MLFWLLYLVVHRLLGTGERASDRRDVEILVLRHQLSVLRRQVKRPSLTRLDRVLLAAAGQQLPRSLWSSFIVSPDTLLRWRRELVRRKWTFRRKARAGRPGLHPETIDLILRLARDNPRWGYHRMITRQAESLRNCGGVSSCRTGPASMMRPRPATLYVERLAYDTAGYVGEGSCECSRRTRASWPRS